MDDMTTLDKLLKLRDFTIQHLLNRIESGKANASDVANVVRLLRNNGLISNEKEEKDRRPPDADDYDFSDAPFPLPSLASTDSAGGLRYGDTPPGEEDGSQKDEEISRGLDPALLAEMPFK